MNPELLPKIINSIGLGFDIIGAWLVAIEVVRQFKGKQQFEDQVIVVFDSLGLANPPEKTKEYEKYENDKYTYMKIGLVSLTIGFLLQIISNWTYLLF